MSLNLDEGRLALRRLTKRPAASIASVLTLACGIGAASATYSLVSAVLLQPLPVEAPARLMAVDVQLYVSRDKTESRVFTGHLYSGFTGIRDSGTFDQLAAAAKAHEVRIDNRDWLPPRLIASAFARAEKMAADGAKFELLPAQVGRLPMILCTMKDGTKVTGKFVVSNGRVAKVTTEAPLRR